MQDFRHHVNVRIQQQSRNVFEDVKLLLKITKENYYNCQGAALVYLDDLPKLFDPEHSEVAPPFLNLSG